MALKPADKVSKEPLCGVKDAEGNSVEVDDKKRACVEVLPAILDDGTEAEYIDGYDPCDVDCDAECPPPKQKRSVLGKHLKLPSWIYNCVPLMEAAVGKRKLVKCDPDTKEMYVEVSDNCVPTVQWNSGTVTFDETLVSSGDTESNVRCIEFTNNSACSVPLTLMADFSILYEHPPDSCYNQQLLLGLNTDELVPALEPGLCIPAGGDRLVRNEAYSWQNCICLAAGETYKLYLAVGMRPSDVTDTDQPPYSWRAWQASMKICPTGA